MVIVLKKGVNKSQTKDFEKYIESFGVKANTIYGAESTVVGLVGDTSVIDIDIVKINDMVEKVIKVQEPYKRANRKFHPASTVIDVNGVLIGGEKIVVMAGPCSVESNEQLDIIAKCCKDNGAPIMRGGAYKPRSSPYSFQGLKEDGLIMLDNVKRAYNIPIISEITNVNQIEQFLKYVDIIQVGARNMQNFELLKELGTVDKPVLLKRGFSNTLEEFLMSAEYIMAGGNSNVMLCERGIRTFETATRNTLDISAIPLLKQLSHLPVIVDPSHASGIASLVEPLSLAAVAAGADGLLIEVHPSPKTALSDGAQSLTPESFANTMNKLKSIAECVGKSI